MRNCERHHFSLASASMEYVIKHSLPLVSNWTQNIWISFCTWLMDESEDDALVLDEGINVGSQSSLERLIKVCIQQHGEYYSGWYKLVKFTAPVPMCTGRAPATGIYCNAGESHECDPFVTFEDGSDDRLGELDTLSQDAVVKALLAEVEP